MAPTKEEECKLKEFKDESPFKLGPAEKFLKAVLDIPFAFKRVDAMLYIANFDSEIEYLKRSFETLEVSLNFWSVCTCVLLVYWVTTKMSVMNLISINCSSSLYLFIYFFSWTIIKTYSR